MKGATLKLSQPEMPWEDDKSGWDKDFATSEWCPRHLPYLTVPFRWRSPMDSLDRSKCLAWVFHHGGSAIQGILDMLANRNHLQCLQHSELQYARCAFHGRLLSSAVSLCRDLLSDVPYWYIHCHGGTPKWVVHVKEYPCWMVFGYTYGHNHSW